MTMTTCVFDAYGTSFGVPSAARHTAPVPGRGALSARCPTLADDGCRKPFDYSWLRAVPSDGGTPNMRADLTPIPSLARSL